MTTVKRKDKAAVIRPAGADIVAANVPELLIGLPTCNSGFDTTALSLFLLHAASAKSDIPSVIICNFFIKNGDG